MADMVWVNQTRPGWPNGDGNSRGFYSLEEAQNWINVHRHARDNDPVWVNYKNAQIDWIIAPEHEPDELDEDGRIILSKWIDNGCMGHETLRGDMMGESFYCDGTCKSA